MRYKTTIQDGELIDNKGVAMIPKAISTAHFNKVFSALPKVVRAKIMELHPHYNKNHVLVARKAAIRGKVFDTKSPVMVYKVAPQMLVKEFSLLGGLGFIYTSYRMHLKWDLELYKRLLFIQQLCDTEVSNACLMASKLFLDVTLCKACYGEPFCLTGDKPTGFVDKTFSDYHIQICLPKYDESHVLCNHYDDLKVQLLSAGFQPKKFEKIKTSNNIFNYLSKKSSYIAVDTNVERRIHAIKWVEQGEVTRATEVSNGGPVYRLTRGTNYMDVPTLIQTTLSVRRYEETFDHNKTAGFTTVSNSMIETDKQFNFKQTYLPKQHEVMTTFIDMIKQLFSESITNSIKVEI